MGSMDKTEIRSRIVPSMPSQRGEFKLGRVERWRGSLGSCLSSPFAAWFPHGATRSEALLRFHLPLIKPDVPISGIRLSDKKSRLRPRETARPPREFNESQPLVQVFIREA
jgi:hypothetical protein